MIVVREGDYNGAPITVDGVEFQRLPDGTVEITTEYPDPTAYDNRHTRRHTTTITRDDWATIVEQLADDDQQMLHSAPEATA